MSEVAIVDYGLQQCSVGPETPSLLCGYNTMGRTTLSAIAACVHVILPGGRRFGEARNKIRARGIDAKLLGRPRVGKGARPSSRFCLGMQLLAETSESIAMELSLSSVGGFDKYHCVCTQRTEV